MNLHNFKCWPAPFQAIVAGDKRADFRRDDRGGFQVGDVVRFMEWAPLLPPPGALPLCYTGAAQLAEITHVQPGGAFGIPEGFAILSFVLLVRPPALPPDEPPPLRPVPTAFPIPGTCGACLSSEPTGALRCRRLPGHYMPHRCEKWQWDDRGPGVQVSANALYDQPPQPPETTPATTPPADLSANDRLPTRPNRLERMARRIGQARLLIARLQDASAGSWNRPTDIGTRYALLEQTTAFLAGPDFDAAPPFDSTTSFPSDPENCSSCKSGIPRFIGRDDAGAIMDIVHAIEPEKFTTGGMMWQQQCTASPTYPAAPPAEGLQLERDRKICGRCDHALHVRAGDGRSLCWCGCTYAGETPPPPAEGG